MPRLHIEGEDRHYTVKTHINGEFQTWQVTDAGVRFTQKKGYYLPQHYDEYTELKSLFAEMIKLGLVYTGKRRQPGAFESDALLDIAPVRLDLRLQEQKPQGWGLTINFVGWPVLQARSGMASHNDCQPSYIQVYDANSYSNRERRVLGSWKLSHIQAGKSCPVEPLSSVYGIAIDGNRSVDGAPRAPTYMLQGLYADGTLFHDQLHEGFRLKTHEVVYPGRSYYFVARAETPPPPKDVRPVSLGIYQTNLPEAVIKRWQAWKISIPENLDPVLYEQVNSWCRMIAHPLRELPWWLVLISPPPLYYANGFPVLEQGRQTIIEVLPPSERIQGAESMRIQLKRNQELLEDISEPISERCSIVLPLNQTGYYRIASSTSLARPLIFSVKHVDKQMPHEPYPLKVQLQVDKRVYEYVAFDKEKLSESTHTLELDRFGEGTIPIFSVTSPVPVDISWTTEDIAQPQWLHAEAAKIDAYVNSCLQYAWKQKKPLSITINASEFGRIHIHIQSTRKQQPITSEPLPTFRRDIKFQRYTHWLIKSAQEHDKEYVLVPVPLSIQARLETLKEKSAYASLSTITQLPQTLLSYLCALTKMLLQDDATH